MSDIPRNSTVATRGEQMFPHLNDRLLADLLPFGEHRTYAAGEVLFAEGDRHVPMVVVLSGAVDIVRHTRDGEVLVTTHTPGSFSGEVGVLAGRGAIASARAREHSRVLVISEAELHRLVVNHAELSELIMRAFILRRVALLEEHGAGVTLIGSRLAPDIHALRQFLTRNGQPYFYLDLDDDPDTAAVMALHQVSADELPVAITVGGQVLRHPSLRELADAVGLTPDRLDGRQVDVVVIGAGPAGLAAAVYAASEGLSVVVVDAKAPGGQAGSSSKIENYFGFPTGISGQALAGRGFVQAQKFGAEVAIPRKAIDFECSHEKGTVVVLDGGERVTARAVVLATGARYRKLPLSNIGDFEGRGVYYGAAFMEAQLCSGQEVIIVGGGNSAGQAAVYLAGYAQHVHILVRSKNLAASMSTYLIRRIDATPRISLHTETEVVELIGNQSLDSVVLKHHRTGALEPRPIQHVFLFCGAEPHTAWLSDCIALDDKGFIRTGSDISAEQLREAEWP
ncbi:MAG TPA: FAD-dependent oxidoreductase, partial [Candidatus Dormibacteraeota bacterium]|nr:FAD-dependent oxidoreductase [Candidatus Dormibacteraeota bacterium]